MANPADPQDSLYLVLVNEEKQYSLWPASGRVPAGWASVHGPAGRGTCLDYVNANWTDLRPRTLVAHMRGADHHVCADTGV